MFIIGIDIGTTSVAGAVIDQRSNRVVTTATRAHEASLSSSVAGLAIQSAASLLDTVTSIHNELITTCKTVGGVSRPVVAGLALTGQVHGIVYFDSDGDALSPAYTWQDTRGAQPGGPERVDESWSVWASRVSGYNVSPGYGLLTHLINLNSDMVPADAYGLASIIGYAGMRLTGNRRCRIDPTDAHALGFFDLSSNSYDEKALSAVGIHKRMLPEVVSSGTQIGCTTDDTPVFVGVGDNQAGFIGSVLHTESTGLVNVGTSAQFSMLASSAQLMDVHNREKTRTLESRPFPGNSRLLSGAIITGGSAYTILENFYREICLQFGGSDPGRIMDRLFSGIDVSGISSDPAWDLKVSTQFRGTREDPGARGSIANISPVNLTHRNLVLAFTRGIVEEIAGYVSTAESVRTERVESVVGIGNGISRNPVLRSTLISTLGVPLLFPDFDEAAAVGAAIVAGVGCRMYRDCTDENRPITYTPITNTQIE